MSCSTCGAALPTGARFCASCGAPVVQAAQEERRIVTILFADLVGFTKLSERLDPEQVKRLVDSCFECLVDVVHEFGGRVDKILGDGMLVLFGAPVAHEDDAERAVRAAMRMQDVLASHAAASPLIGSNDIQMRVGINTGEVLVGTLAGTDYTAMGDVVNTAQRLQAAAPPGGVYVGGSTYALTAHTVQYASAGDLVAKGREQAVPAWMALHATAPPGSRRSRRRDIPLIGRDAEFTVVEAAGKVVLHRGRALALNIVGEGGVGKSRLVDEVVGRFRNKPGAAVLEGACVPYGESNIWFPIASALATYLDLDQSQPAAELRAVATERSRAFFPEATPAEHARTVDVFAHLMGHPSAIDKMDPAVARSTIHHAVASVLDVRAQDGPVVLSVDDLHWADPGLLALLEHTVNALSRRPFVLVTAMRPGTEVLWPPRSERTTTVSITLQPLSREDTEALARALLGDNEAAGDHRLLNALFERSGGNPLFLQELVALTEGGSRSELPDSLRSLIAARLDQLTLEQRQMLENAAVLGTAGLVKSLERFASEAGQTFHHSTLDELDDAGLLMVHGRRWEFRSDSVRDAAYQTLTKTVRAQRHAGVARALTTMNAPLDDRAHHMAAAAELMQEFGRVEGVPADIAQRAMSLLTAAADRALDSGSLRAAVRFSTRAIGLATAAQTADADIARLRIVRAAAEIEQRSYDAATADIEAITALADRLEDPVIEAEAHRLNGMLANVAGRMDEARTELGVAVDLLRQCERPDLLARALRIRGFIEMFGGSLVDAEWFFGEADALYRELGDERGMAYIDQHRAWIAFLSNDLPTARQRLSHAAETLGGLGDRNGVGWAFGLMAFIEFFEGHFDEAERLARVVAREADERGDDWAVGMMDTLLADLSLWRGHLEPALSGAEKARGRFKRLADKFGLVQALAPLVRAQVALGMHSAAQRTAEELLALAETGRHGPFPLLAVAGAAMHRGLGPVAEHMADRAINELQAIGAATFEPEVVLAVAQLQQGRVDDALVTMERCTARQQHPFTMAAAALIHAAAGQDDDALEATDAVISEPGASYLDQVFAYVAAAGAAARLGQAEQAELSAQAAVARALGTGDVVAMSLATHTYAAVTGNHHPAHDERTPLGDGWATVVRLVTAR